jgi:hypothetical protein
VSIDADTNSYSQPIAKHTHCIACTCALACSADVRIASASNTSEDPSDDYQLPTDTPNSQTPDDALTHAAARRDVPAWEAKISVLNAPFGVPKVVKMHSGGWQMMEMAPRIRKEAARQQPEGGEQEQVAEMPVEQPDAAREVPSDLPAVQPELGRRMLLH